MLSFSCPWLISGRGSMSSKNCRRAHNGISMVSTLLLALRMVHILLGARSSARKCWREEWEMNAIEALGMWDIHHNEKASLIHCTLSDRIHQLAKKLGIKEKQLLGSWDRARIALMKHSTSLSICKYWKASEWQVTGVWATLTHQGKEWVSLCIWTFSWLDTLCMIRSWLFFSGEREGACAGVGASSALSDTIQ